MPIRWCSDLIDDEYREQVMATFLYRHPKRDRKSERRRSLIVALSLAALVGVYFVSITIAPLLAVSGQTSAGNGPKIVWGFVYDVLGIGINGVLVTVIVEIPDGGGERASLSNTSFAGGIYTVTFPNDQWYVDDTILVSAEWGSETAANSTVIAGEGDEKIDLHFEVPIPEVSPGIAAVVTVSVLVGISLVVRRRQGRNA